MKRFTFTGTPKSAAELQTFTGWKAHDIYHITQDTVMAVIPANMGKQIILNPGDVVLKDDAGNLYVDKAGQECEAISNA